MKDKYSKKEYNYKSNGNTSNDKPKKYVTNKKKKRFRGSAKANNPRYSKKDFKDDDLVSETNAEEWYGIDAAILRDAASFPWSYPAGIPIGMEYNGSSYTYSVPGIMAYELIPNVGESIDGSSAINVAAQALYSRVRHQNSGSANYDVPDLMVYCLCNASVYAYINFLMRTYAMATTFSQMNKYIGSGLLAASKVDYDDVIIHLADFRYGINMLINKAASLAVPADMSYFKRQAFLYQNYYSEGLDVKDQLYLYVPAGFYMYDPLASGGAAARFEPFAVFDHEDSIGVYKVDELIEYGLELLAPLVADEDSGIMSGDILKAYGDNIIKLAPIGPDYTIDPLYDPAVLDQMRNALPLAIHNMSASQMANQLSVKQARTDDMNPIIYNANLWSTLYGESARLEAALGRSIITTTSNAPTPGLTMEITRLRPTIDTVNNSVMIFAGTEVCVSISMIVRSVLQGNPYKLTFSRFTRHWPFIATDTNITLQMEAVNLYNFDYRPAYMYFYKNSDDTYQPLGYTCDFDNYTILSKTELKRLHDVAILNELHVPLIGKITQ